MNLSIILLFIGILLCIIGLTSIYKKYEYNKSIEQKNIEIQKINDTLNEHKQKLNNECSSVQQNIINKLKEYNEIDEKINNTKEGLNNSFSNYVDILENDYKEKEEEYNKLLVKLEYSYDNEYDRLKSERENIEKELKDLKNTRNAAIEAQLKEKEIKENKEFYSLSISDTDLADVRALERIKKDLSKPRILSMLIWSTYFQKPMTSLCNNILGTFIICGIYKITNQKTGECYIGQAVDVAKRWKDHAKCGLDIDRPQGNKLYKAMVDEGIWNFSFELLEECNRDKLDEKEKFYIDLYDSYNYGYNSTIGNNKK